MQEDSKNIDTIEKYLHEEMTHEELGNFKDQLKADHQLTSETALMHDLIKGIRKGGELDLEKTLIEVRTKLKKEGFFDQKEAIVKPLKSRQNWLAYAAAIVVLIAATFFFLDLKNQQNIQVAIDSIESQKMPEMVSVLDGLESFGLADDDRERKNSLLNIIELAKEVPIESTKEAFEEHMEYYPRDETAKLLFGIELLNENLPEEAINQLNFLSNKETFQYQNLAKLNLAKAHLIIGEKENMEAAEVIFHSLLLTSDGDYSNLAKRILEKIN
ncbi:MAG: hypothetical protein NXI23_09315 [Bacteroidetes bacterium]|jgi:hypothetical protein|nr:hypothetical protein [Bacteroidota bacterium]MDF1864870.1 hypothetical protein [Saprospiraceae bacterium]